MLDSIQESPGAVSAQLHALIWPIVCLCVYFFLYIHYIFHLVLKSSSNCKCNSKLKKYFYTLTFN